MKIGIFRRRYSPHGGGERFAHQFLQSLASAGYDVHLFCEAWTDIPAGVTLRRVPTLRGGSALRTLGYAVLAPNLARRVGVDLVHSFERTFRQDLYRAGEGCHRQWLALSRQHLRGPLRALDRVRPFHRVVLAIERRMCQKNAAKVLVVNSKMVENDFARHYPPLRAATALIRNGVDLKRFHPDVRSATRGTARESLGLRTEQLVLVIVGSGFSRKGVPTAIRALGYLRRKAGLTPVLLIAGKGNQAPLRSLAEREGVEQQVRFLGIVEDTTPLYGAADVFVLPSVYDPASNATLEALGMGLPVITTRTNGSAEILEEGRSGWIVSGPSDFLALASLIEGASDSRVRISVGEAGRRAVGPWSLEHHLNEALALYRPFSGAARQR